MVIITVFIMAWFVMLTYIINDASMPRFGSDTISWPFLLKIFYIWFPTSFYAWEIYCRQGTWAFGVFYILKLLIVCPYINGRCTRYSRKYKSCFRCRSNTWHIESCQIFQHREMPIAIAHRLNYIKVMLPKVGLTRIPIQKIMLINIA